jgi:hypothetical protein
MTRDDLERLARDVAGNTNHRQRVLFQARHPHYTPPQGAGEGNDEVLALSHAAARKAYTEQGQQYDRRAVWMSLGIDMDTLIETLGKAA